MCVCVCVYAYVLPVMRCLVHKWVWLHVDVDSICLDDMNMCTRVCAQVGLGLGAWCVVAPLQTKLNVHTVLNILAKVCICVFGGGPKHHHMTLSPTRHPHITQPQSMAITYTMLARTPHNSEHAAGASICVSCYSRFVGPSRAPMPSQL